MIKQLFQEGTPQLALFGIMLVLSFKTPDTTLSMLFSAGAIYAGTLVFGCFASSAESTCLSKHGEQDAFDSQEKTPRKIV